MIMLGDQPAVPVEVVDRVIDAWRQSGKGLVLPVYGGRRGHPLLVDMRLSEEVLSLEPAKGMRAMLISNAGGIMEVPVATPAVLKDIDTPEDYEELMEGGGV